MSPPSVTDNPLPVHPTPAVRPLSGGVYSIELEREEYDSHIFMLEWDTPEIEMMDMQEQAIETEPTPMRVDIEPLEHDLIVVLYQDSDEDEMDYEPTMIVAEVTAWPTQIVSTPVILTPRAPPIQVPVTLTLSSPYQPSHSVVLIPRVPASSAEVQVMTRAQIMREWETRVSHRGLHHPLGQL